MDEEIRGHLDAQDKKLDAIYRSAEKTRKYFLWALIISIVFIVLPLIGLAFIAPFYIKTIGLNRLGL